MVLLMIKNPALPADYTIENVSWWLSETLEFRPGDILRESIEDPVNKLSIQFDIDLEIGKKYYAKCRVVYNKGFSNDSNINIFIARDLNEIDLDIVAPTKISRPTIEILPDVKSKPLGMLTFKGGEFLSKFNVGHESSTYILEDINGKVIWSKPEDSTNLTEIKLPIGLEPNSAYRLLLAYTGKNHNTSQFAIKTFTTGDNEIKLKGSLDSVPAQVDLTVQTNLTDVGLVSATYRLYAEGIFLVDTKTILASSGDDLDTYVIPANLLDADVNYNIHVTTVGALNIEKNGYFYFKPYFDLSETPDFNFLYENNVKEWAASYTSDIFSNASGYRPELPNKEIIQIVSKLGAVSLMFYKLDHTTGKFNFTGRSFNLGILKASVVAVDAEFSYRLMKNNRLVIKGHKSGVLISIPYNSISGDVDINNMRYNFTLGEIASTNTMQHAICPMTESMFVAFNMENGRLAAINNLDLSSTFLSAKVYDVATNLIGLYKISKSLVMILHLDAFNNWKFDVFDYETKAYTVTDRVLLANDSNPDSLAMIDGNNKVLVKVVALFNGKVLMTFLNGSNENTYKTYDITSTDITPLMIKQNGIGLGVYSLLKDGKMLQLNDTKEILFY